MDEKQNLYPIPANFTDSGKILGGMFHLRNAIEAIVLVVAFGFYEHTLLPMSGIAEVIVMAITLIPLAVISLLGLNGESLLRFIGHILCFLFTSRRLHFRRIEHEEAQAPNQL